MLSPVQTGPAVDDSGLEVVDLYTEPSFMSRPLRDRDRAPHLDGMRRLAHAFVEHPDTLLQQLVNCAIELCGADSAGISLQQVSETGEVTYHWVATAGSYARFLDAVLPAFPSACGLCLERNRPQLFRVDQRFFDVLKVEAEEALDGVLMPWHVGETNGTIWIISHTRREAFNRSDAQTMELLADFAAMAIRQRSQGKLILDQASATAANAMANELAHQINNPLQSLTNLVFLAAEGELTTDIRTLAREMSDDLRRLSVLVNKLLALPTGSTGSVS